MRCDIAPLISLFRELLPSPIGDTSLSEGGFGGNRFVLVKSFAAFSLAKRATKKKLPKRNGVMGEISPSADGEEASEPPLRHLLKKVDENFQ